MSQIKKLTLDNGARILLEHHTHVQSAAVGLWCRTGSRHETETEAGITHFIEHMLFKGTQRRTAKQIAESIEGRGGILNAFTDKEQTCYYARVLSDDVLNAVDVLSDMLLHSKLDPEEIQREKGVILEEIKRGEDEPGDHVHELHVSNLWGEHPLGKPIIGTKESVSSFQRPDFTGYIDRRYRGESVVLGIAGNFDVDAVIESATSLLQSLDSGLEEPTTSRPTAEGRTNMVSDDVEQVHFCIGGDSVDLYSEDLYAVAVMDAILGGGMSSRLFQEVRERRGLAYSVGSYNMSYSHGGAFVIYGGTGQETWTQTQEVIHNEIAKIQTELVPDEEFDRTKRQMKGTMVLALEGMNARMSRMVKNEFNHGREIPIEETLAKIEAVSREDVLRIAGQVLNRDRLTTTAIGRF